MSNGLQSRLDLWRARHGIAHGMAERGFTNSSAIQQLSSAIDNRVGVSFFTENTCDSTTSSKPGLKYAKPLIQGLFLLSSLGRLCKRKEPIPRILTCTWPVKFIFYA